MDGRVADLAAAIESPGADERLRFARDVVERNGIAIGQRLAMRRGDIWSSCAHACSRTTNDTCAGWRPCRGRPVAATRGARDALSRPRTFVRHVTARRLRARATLAALRDRGELAGRPVERVAVVGPGLDFVDKAQGYDFYPVQTIQPFAVADSLRRLGTAARPTVTTLDISRRVIAHLREARQRAAQGQAYRVNAVLEQDSAASRLDPALVEYWRRFGDRVGSADSGRDPRCLRRPGPLARD